MCHCTSSTISVCASLCVICVAQVRHCGTITGEKISARASLYIHKRGKDDGSVSFQSMIMGV